MKKLSFCNVIDLKKISNSYVPTWDIATNYINQFHENLNANPSSRLGIEGWLHPTDALKIYELAFFTEGLIVELGTYQGLSCSIMAKATIDSGRKNEIITIDLENHFKSVAINNVAKIANGANIGFQTGDAKELVQDLIAAEKKATLLFVDHAHTYAPVFEIGILAEELVSDNGYVLFHDFLNEENFDQDDDKMNVTSAVMDSINQSSQFEFVGLFGCSVLYKKVSRRRLTPKTPLTDIKSFGQKSKDSFPKTLPDGSPWPKISIVTPSFNQGRFLEDMIQSVMDQNYPNLEHIFIDGGSNDETMQIVNEYREHFAYIVSEPDNGQSNAINKGFAQATGDIFTWLNCDDQLAPGALFAIALAFYYSKADLVAGVCRVFNEDGTEMLQHLTGCFNGPLPLEDLLDIENRWLSGQFFYQPEVMFTRRLWERAGGYVDESLVYSMDYELWVRFAAKCARLHVISRPIAVFRLHEQQKTNTVETYLPELLQVSDKLSDKYLSQKVNRPKKSNRNKLKILFFNDLGNHYGAGIAHERFAKACALVGHDVTFLGYSDKSDMAINDMLFNQTIERVISTNPDLIVVGNIHGIPNAEKLLIEISKKFPTLFIMHDKWLLTGRCAYNGSCDRYLFQCDDSCPSYDEYPSLPKDLIKVAWNLKREALNDNLKVLCVSDWLKNWVSDAYLSQKIDDKKQQFANTSFGLDLSIFKLYKKKYCRSILNLPHNKFILVIMAAGLHDRRKGFEHLKRAIELLVSQKHIAPDNILVVGIGTDTKLTSIPGMQTTGYISDQQELAMYQAAADVFVGPSLEEAFGQVFIEAAACGTPAIAYALDGVNESVVDGITGRLAQGKSPAKLMASIEELYLDYDKRSLISKTAPLYVENEFSYLASYRSFMLGLKQIGMLDELELKQVIQVPSSQSSKLRYDYILKNPMSIKNMEDESSLHGFEMWFERLLIWQSSSSYLPIGLKERLVKNIVNKKIVVFGASGSYKTGLKEILDEFKIKPAYFVDNDPNKLNKNLDGVSIYSPAKLMTENKEEIFVFITSIYYKEIKQQLQLYGLLEYRNFIRAC